MNFYSMRDLRTGSKNMWADLTRGDEVVLTNNGKPSALVVDIPEGSFDEIIQAVRQAKAMIALNNMRRRAAREGYKTDEEIESLVDEARGGGRP
ncbi:MAG: type II toxin-antitoxin system Phd/YefM family antitoxin [Clostridia bacterium]|nr:type II toxin-antitoxin system Phd/YefM family antitoxin [Clostridia bacterium]